MHSRASAAVVPWLSGRTLRGALVCTLLLASGGALSFTSGCALDAHDLDAFRTTASGPDKLKALVEDPSRPADLRAEAALRLLRDPAVEVLISGETAFRDLAMRYAGILDRPETLCHRVFYE